MRVWLDTDIGTDVDDALALAFVLKHPDLQLVGVSTVFGDVELRADIARALLDLGPAADRSIPVLAGHGVPLTDRRHGIMFGHEGRGLLDDPAPVLRLRSETGAEKRIEAIGQAMRRAEPDVVVAIGPLTNLGALAGAGVELPPLAIMGGRFEDVQLPGMSPEVSEWNWHCDPVAVQRVLGAGSNSLPLIVPAEVTFRTRLAADDIERLAAGDPLCRAAADLCRRWLDVQREQFGIEQPIVALHDPLTAALLVEPQLCQYRHRRVEVDDGGWSRAVPGAANLRSATSVEAADAAAAIMAVLAGPG